jgi:hypothetical protein
METPNSLVFINCPFDSDYQPLLEAIVFAVSACQYTPRCASEIIGSGYNRLHKILDLIDICDLSIHDISRVELTKNQLPRFNMPFELGLALGRKTNKEHAAKLLVLDCEPLRYLEFLSDLRGCDPLAHKGNPHTVITQVRNWLSSYHMMPLNGPAHLIEWFKAFSKDLPDICLAWGFDRQDMPFKDLVFSVHYWLEANVPLA